MNITEIKVGQLWDSVREKFSDSVSEVVTTTGTGSLRVDPTELLKTDEARTQIEALRELARNARRTTEK